VLSCANENIKLCNIWHLQQTILTVNCTSHQKAHSNITDLGY